MRMQMRRFTRLTNAFSKKIENHAHALALYFFWYNWVRSHKAHKPTPAMAAWPTSSPMELADLVELINIREQGQLQDTRCTMKRRNSNGELKWQFIANIDRWSCYAKSIASCWELQFYEGSPL